jgi:GTPase SAR1 family protein
MYLKNKTGIILIYAVNDTVTLDELKERLKVIVEEKGVNFPIVICGNKADLEEEKEVFLKDSDCLLTGLTNAEIIETSAKSGQNCSEAFIKLCNRISGKSGKSAEKKKGIFRLCNLL